jgi:hypothetical protein
MKYRIEIQSIFLFFFFLLVLSFMGIRWTEFQGETMFWDKVTWCFAVMIIFYIKIIFYISKNIFLKKFKIKKIKFLKNTNRTYHKDKEDFISSLIISCSLTFSTIYLL